MAKLTGKQIRELARSIVLAKPTGLRYAELVKQIHQQHPETPENTISGNTYNLEAIFLSEITKPSRGLFVPAAKPSGKSVISANAEQVTPAGAKVKESDFYQPFADWLKDDINEVIAAVSLGGNSLKSK